MATILKQLNTTPQADGTAVTAGPGNSNWSSLTTGAGNTHTFRDAAKMGAGAGYRITQAGANQALAYLDLDAAVNDFEFRVELDWSGTLAASTTILRGLGDLAHTNALWSILITTTGRVQFVETAAGGLNVTSPSTAGMTLSPGTDYTLIGQVDVGTSTLSIDCYVRGTTTKLFTLTGTLVGTTPTYSLRWGIGTASSGMTSLDTNSNFAIGTGGKIARADLANTAPVVTVDAYANATAGATATVTASATDDGTIASYAWSVVTAKSTATPTLSNASTSSVSFTAPAAGNLVTLQCVVTDNLGASTTVETEVRVPSSAASVRHLALDGSSVGTWTKAGGATSHGGALNDESDTTYDESPTLTAVETSLRVRLAPMTTRTGYRFTERFSLSAAGTATVKFRVFEGTTLREEFNVTGLTTTPQTYTFDLTNPGAIVDPGNLFGELAGTGA